MSPSLEYASSLWSPMASPTSINKLQVMQNAALRACTGCTHDTNIQHLHDKTNILPILKIYNYSGGKKNMDLLLFYQKRTNKSETSK